MSKFDDIVPQITCVGECDRNFHTAYPPIFIDCEITEGLLAECFQLEKPITGYKFSCEPCDDPIDYFYVVSGSCQVEIEHWVMRGL